jgi:hypothetical protein
MSNTRLLPDPAVGLTCFETPFYPPKSMGLSDMAKCDSCDLTFTAPINGPKTINTRAGMDGLSIDESPLTELSYNGTKYALYDTVLWAKQGAHRYFKRAAPYDMEMNLYFRDAFNPFKLIAMAIPIKIDDAKGNAYFTEMALQNMSIRTVSLDKIISSGPVIMYKGMDLRNRRSDKPTQADHCYSSTANMTWFVLQPTHISSRDAAVFRGMDYLSNILPPAPAHELTLERVRNMCMTIDTITVKNILASPPPDNKGIYLTRALQCQRIDPNTDIKDGAVYLDGAGAGPTQSLEDELDEANAADSSKDYKKSTINAGKIEDNIAMVLGLIIGFACFSVLSYLLFRLIFSGYVPTIKGLDLAYFDLLAKVKPPPCPPVPDMGSFATVCDNMAAATVSTAAALKGATIPDV